MANGLRAKTPSPSATAASASLRVLVIVIRVVGCVLFLAYWTLLWWGPDDLIDGSLVGALGPCFLLGVITNRWWALLLVAAPVIIGLPAGSDSDSGGDPVSLAYVVAVPVMALAVALGVLIRRGIGLASREPRQTRARSSGKED